MGDSLAMVRKLLLESVSVQGRAAWGRARAGRAEDSRRDAEGGLPFWVVFRSTLVPPRCRDSMGWRWCGVRRHCMIARQWQRSLKRRLPWQIGPSRQTVRCRDGGRETSVAIALLGGAGRWSQLRDVYAIDLGVNIATRVTMRGLRRRDIRRLPSARVCAALEPRIAAINGVQAAHYQRRPSRDGGERYSRDEGGPPAMRRESWSRPDFNRRLRHDRRGRRRGPGCAGGGARIRTAKSTRS